MSASSRGTADAPDHVAHRARHVEKCARERSVGRDATSLADEDRLFEQGEAIDVAPDRRHGVAHDHQPVAPLALTCQPKRSVRDVEAVGGMIPAKVVSSVIAAADRSRRAGAELRHGIVEMREARQPFFHGDSRCLRPSPRCGRRRPGRRAAASLRDDAMGSLFGRERDEGRSRCSPREDQELDVGRPIGMMCDFGCAPFLSGLRKGPSRWMPSMPGRRSIASADGVDRLRMTSRESLISVGSMPVVP